MPAPYRALSNYAVGTVTVANGQSTATLTNAFVRVQDQAREYWLVRPDDLLVIDGVGATFVRDVDAVLGAADATLSLTAPWPHATQNAVAYRIVRFSQVSDGEARSLLQTLLAKGGASAPDIARYLDDSQARMRVGPYAGVPSLRVGPTGAADGAMYAAVTADPTTGAVSFPSGVRNWAIPGFRNLLLGSGFRINKRGVPTLVTLAPGAYGHDGVKAGSGGATYETVWFGTINYINVTAGSVILPIDSDWIVGGDYVLSHEGSALARVWQGGGFTGSGSYAAATRSSPLRLPGLTLSYQTNVEFSTGSIIRPQFERGAYASDYEYPPPNIVDLSQKYLISTYHDNVAPGTASGAALQAVVSSTVNSSGYLSFSVPFPTRMRAVPTVTLYSSSGAAGNITVGISNAPAVPVEVFEGGFGALYNLGPDPWPAGSVVKFHYLASAEL